MSASARLAELGIALPAVAKPVAAYVPAARVGGQIWTSGQLPSVDGVLTATGKLGAEVDVAGGQKAAELCALNILAQVKVAVGDLDRLAFEVDLVIDPPAEHDRFHVLRGEEQEDRGPEPLVDVFFKFRYIL